MDRLQKIAYVTGIIIAITLLVLIIISYIPTFINMTEQVEQDIVLSQDEYLEKFHTHPAYFAFYEKYPDAQEVLKINRYGVELQVIATDPTFTIQLGMAMIYEVYNDYIDVDIWCERPDANVSPMYAEEPLIILFIKNTKCLEEPIEEIS